jgi:cathepsin L
LKDGQEFVKRLEIFEKNLKTIEEHNAQKSTYKMGVNKFTHLTFEEFKKAVNLRKIESKNLREPENALRHGEPKSMKDVPDSVNWVTKGAVTPVKDQGQCGSCWSFSATGGLEGAYAVKNGKLPSAKGFSEQELVSCNDHPNQGCNGGWAVAAFQYAKRKGGLPTEEDYPYVSGNGKVPACDSSKTAMAGAGPASYTKVQEGSVSALMSAVAQQPTSIAIQADQPSFQHYESGVFTGTCGQQLDHAVLNVGYGTESGLDYWLVKNSWGTSWGDQGYIKIEKSDKNLCGVLSSPSYPSF